ncbi:MAG: N-acetyltransferase [Proteobacteria bacterium]|nr:N-acetyltransferase [Pseudomonadota bacterium]
MSEKVVREQQEHKGRYVFGADEPRAEMTYSQAGESVWIIDHTLVPERFRGQGIGGRLVLAAVEDARREGHRIVPLCPFAAAQFRKHPEYADVLQD